MPKMGWALVAMGTRPEETSVTQDADKQKGFSRQFKKEKVKHCLET